MRVADLILPHQKPTVKTNTSIKNVLVEITQKRLGAAAVTNDAMQVTGIITDGDIRRMLEKYDSFSALMAKDIMSVSPKIIDADALAAEAFEKMSANNISQLVVIKDGVYAGIIHIHDLIKEGII